MKWMKPLKRSDEGIAAAESVGSCGGNRASFGSGPHPCGYWGNSGEKSTRQCRCAFRQIENYRERISGPLQDRIDLNVEVPLVDFRELSSNTNTGESSESIRQRGIAARDILHSSPQSEVGLGSRRPKDFRKRIVIQNPRRKLWAGLVFFRVGLWSLRPRLILMVIGSVERTKHWGNFPDQGTKAQSLGLQLFVQFVVLLDRCHQNPFNFFPVGFEAAAVWVPVVAPMVEQSAACDGVSPQ